VKDVAGAKAFYSAVLRWAFDDVPLPDGGVYPIAKVGGRSVGAIFNIIQM
jgi:predicted enzyme related to lactoylglutathione lyase